MLAKFLPDFPSKSWAQKIRISHLLAHTSGLGSFFNDKYWATPKEKLKNIDDYFALIKNQQPEFEPGSKWQYSNSGFVILGKLIEHITQKSYYDYIQENIYAPAGMTQTGSFDITKVNLNLAVGYDKDFTDDSYTFNNNLLVLGAKGSSAGGGYSTVGDLLKFSQALKTGKLIKPTMLEKNLLQPTLNKNYGLGFELSPKSFGHSGATPGVGAELKIYPHTNYTFIVLSNYSIPVSVSVKLEDLIDNIKDK